MANFPTLVPSGRTFTPGDYPNTSFSVLSGKQTRVRHSTVMLSSQLRLTFVALTEADMLSVLSHYNGQLGSYESFALPSAIWSGVTANDFQLSGYRWRYIESPTVEDLVNNRHTVSLVLESVTGEGATTTGVLYGVLTSIVTGQAFGSPFSPVATGISLTVTAELGGGYWTNGSDVQTTREDYTVTVTFTPGAGDGNATSGAQPFWLDWGWQASDITLF
jgi:hypothetical protein